MRLAVVLLLFSSACTAVAFAEGFEYPLDVAVDSSGAVFVADRNLPGLWRVQDGKLGEFFKASKQFRTPLAAVRCVAVDGDGHVLAGDSSTRDVYRFDESGKPTALTGGKIGIPMSLAVGSSKDIFVADLELHCIWRIPAAGGKPEKFADVKAPRGISFDGEGRLWVVSHGDNQLVRLTADAKQEIVVKGRPFQFPHDVAIDDDGVAYVSDGYAKSIWKVADGKQPEKWITGAPLDNPVGVCWHDKMLWVSDPRAKCIFQAAPGGELKQLELK